MDSKGLLTAGAHLAYPLAYAWTQLASKGQLDRDDRFGGGAWKDIVNRELWFHAASVGEVEGLRPVIVRMSSQEPIISTTSYTGKQKARTLTSSAALLPLDHPAIVRPLMSRLHPQVLVITETEVWPQLFFAAKENQVPIVLVNSRISDYTFPKYKLASAVLKSVFEIPEVICAQSDEDAARFETLGARSVIVAGSSKYDVDIQEQTGLERRLRFAELGLDADKPCFIAGSVRPAEAEIVLSAFLKARTELPNLQLILAPRHPEKFDECARILERYQIDFYRRSKRQVGCPRTAVLLDSLGELRQIYSLADAAFIGATLVDVGGHNPLEPAAYGVPVILGPYSSNVRGAVSDLKRRDGMCEVRGAEDLSRAIVRFAADSTEKHRVGAAARAVWKQHRGATEKIVKTIEQFLQARPRAKFA